jgi:DNA-binding MarR family transcriptional regulator
MQALWAVVHGLQRVSKRMSSELGVTGPQRLVLRVVGLFPGTSASDVATILHVHPSTLTGVLQRLEDQKLLRRMPHTEDRRRTVLHLTARGDIVNRQRTATVEAAVTETLARVPAADRHVTGAVLLRLAGQLAQTAREKASTRRRNSRTPR